MKAILIGIDGATWTIINPLLKAGRLPNLAKLMQESCSGTLISPKPLISPRIWTTIATGKVAEKHGIHDFYSTGNAVKVNRIWDILGGQGWKTGTFSWPITWPPEDTCSFMIPDWLARSPQTHPEDLQFIKEMEDMAKIRENLSITKLIKYGISAIEYGVSLRTLCECMAYIGKRLLLNYDEFDYYWHERKLQLLLHTEIFLNLVERYKPHFTAFYTDILDKVCHKYWRFIEPTKWDVSFKDVKKYGDIINRSYQYVDWALGRILKSLHDTIVMVTSDHGFMGVHYGRNFCMWINLQELIKILDIKGYFSASKIGKILYLRLKAGIKNKRIMARTKEALEKTYRMEDNARIFHISMDTDHTIEVELNDEIKISKDDQIVIAGQKITVSKILLTQAAMSGDHHPEGIFILKGPGIKTGGRISYISPLDLVPTLLFLIGLPVAKDMDGKVCLQAFSKEFLSTHRMEFVETYDKKDKRTSDLEFEEDSAILAKLRALGYTD